jgi:hypothetical protein
MTAFRNIIFSFRYFALWVFALALCVKAFVPAGYMVDRNAMILTVVMCADSQANVVTREIIIPIKSTNDSQQSEHRKIDGHCAFTSLGFCPLEAVDAALLAAGLLISLILAYLVATKQHFSALSWLMPPAQAPPIFG